MADLDSTLVRGNLRVTSDATISGDVSATNVQASTFNGYPLSGGVGTNTIPVRDNNGFVYFNYINTNVPQDTPSSYSGISFLFTDGDSWIRKSSPSGAKSAMGINFDGTLFYSGNQNNAEHDANNVINNGVYWYNSNGPSTNLGASVSDGALYVQAWDQNWVGQIAQDYRNGRLFVRGKNNGTWTDWKRIAQYEEIPTSLPADGGNADTVDNEHASAFVHKSGDTMDGNLWFTAGHYISLNQGSGSSVANYISAGGGYSPSSGRYGVKVASCDQGDCISGLGQDLNPNGYPYDLCIVGSNSSGDVGHISFVTHKDGYWTTYREIANFYDNAGNVTFTVNGSIVENGVSLSNKYLQLSNGTSPVHFNTNNLPQFNGSIPYFVGIEAFDDGGTLKWQSASDVSVGYATSAGNADTVDSKHASDFVYYAGNQTDIGGGSPFSGATAWFDACTSTNAMVYNSNGIEYTMLGSQAPGRAYGTILRWGYNDKYMYIARKNVSTWQSQDWEKISAGYADSAGNSNTVGGLGVHAGRNNEANKIVRTDEAGYLQTGYINSNSGDEGNYSSPARIWGTNGSDSYLRTYRADYVNVGSANLAYNIIYTNRAGDGDGHAQFAQYYGATDNPSDDWYSHIIMNHANAEGYYTEIATHFHGDNVYFRRKAGVVTSDWKRFAFTGEAQPANGGNADTVDNEHANAFVHKNIGNVVYTNLGYYYNAGQTHPYIRITLPERAYTWAMFTLEFTIRKDYQSGNGGKLLVNGCWWSAQDQWQYFKSVHDYALRDITVYSYDKRHIYIGGINGWGGLSLDRILCGDNVTGYDISDVVIDGVDALPDPVNSATKEIRAITSLLDNYLPLSGGTVTGNLTVNGSLVGNTGGYIVGRDDSAFVFQAKSGYTYCNLIFNGGDGTILGNLGFSASKALQIYDRRDGVTQGWKDVALREDFSSYVNDVTKNPTLPKNSPRNFVNGTLVTTDFQYDADHASGVAFYMEIKGDLYGQGRMFTQVNGYIWDNTIINYGVNNLSDVGIAQLIAMSIDGKLCFWWPRLGYWQSFSVVVYESSGGDYHTNHVISVTDSADVTTAVKRIDLATNLISTINTSNIGSQSVSNADTVDNMHASDFVYYLDAPTATPNGSTITNPGGANAFSIRTRVTEGRDIGILYMSDDNAYICNSSDNAYNFGVFDTDRTVDFSDADNAEFVVLGAGVGCKINGNTVIHAGNISAYASKVEIVDLR